MRPGARPPRRRAEARPVDFGAFVRARSRAGDLVVQPRMGFSDPATMRAGLAATRAADAATVGTLTLDSYTRVGELDSVDAALRAGADLNGYPIVSYDPAVTGQVLAGIRDETFPVQVRHGSAVPGDIFAALRRTLINATEGGPVSYCLPYGRTPLDESVRNWVRCTEDFAQLRESGVEPHLETFGGCMLGQLCPPSQLVAISVLEALFFCQHGIRSVSLSYAQQTHPEQDREAVAALRRLCAELLPTSNWHVVIYAYMGVYPTTDDGAYLLLDQATRLAVDSGSERLIVKTVAESRRIPTVAENIAALESAARTARTAPTGGQAPTEADSQTYAEARALVEGVLALSPDIGHALTLAFRQGALDIPYCLHPDNHGRARSYIDGDGRLRWAGTGRLPLAGLVGRGRAREVTSAGLITDLSYVQRAFDRAAMESGDARHRDGADIAPAGLRSLPGGESRKRF
ncbi:methylaspartate mutase [Streptomyces sp. RKAG290]|uniref:methylaspartate mutase n=1 Tax=Streptomyces sp. RKAG290 TaxID=2888348 RepID=UPI002033F35A|nr:methylaspartate mutase [Streptomyces sp. RKAG290]MCM2411587.1 methylaspartate mutase [Streptomyces sp. RKAG290]